MKTEGSDGERMFITYVIALQKKLLIGMRREFRFYDKRGWRFDFAWPDVKVAVEIDGGQHEYMGGRHNTDEDREKINTASAMGWTVLRFSTSALKNDPYRCIQKLSLAMDANRRIK